MYPPQICGTRLINETDINIMVHGYKKQNKRKFYSHPPKKKKKRYKFTKVKQSLQKPETPLSTSISRSLSLSLG